MRGVHHSLEIAFVNVCLCVFVCVCVCVSMDMCMHCFVIACVVCMSVNVCLFSLFEFLCCVCVCVSKKRFLDLKSKERVNRYEKYFNEDSNLEPHIKEGLGAIRDLNTVTWITNFLNLGKNYKELHENKFLDKDEYKDFLEVTKFMYTLRCTLHIIANRREDRLLFDFQEDLANKLGYKKTKTKRASENLMHQLL